VTRRQKRATRTVRFLGGPMHEKLVQIPRDVSLAQFTVGPGRFDHYVGPAGAGAAVFVYRGTHDREGHLLEPLNPLGKTTFHVKPEGSDEWLDITKSVVNVTLHPTDDADLEAFAAQHEGPARHDATLNRTTPEITGPAWKDPLS
jgi:hypothetical protein